MKIILLLYIVNIIHYYLCVVHIFNTKIYQVLHGNTNKDLLLSYFRENPYYLNNNDNNEYYYINNKSTDSKIISIFSLIVPVSGLINIMYTFDSQKIFPIRHSIKRLHALEVVQPWGSIRGTS